MFDMFGKMQELQKQVDEMKKRLDDITVDAEAGGGAVKVIATGNRRIKSVIISDEIVKEGDKEQIEDLVTVAVNRAMEQAKALEESEMKGMAGGLLPPGMGM